MRDRFAYNELSISSVCNQYGQSRQAYYKNRKRQLVAEQHNDQLLSLVNEKRMVLAREGGRKLYLKLKPQLHSRGINIGRDKFFDFLRGHGLLIKPRKQYVRTTDSKHRFRIYQNLILDKEVLGINQQWVSDITYISTDQGFMYLALITDAYSRKIVGYDISDSLELEGCLRALKMAAKNLPKQHKLIHHSDRGIQYCSKQYTRFLKKHKIQISMAAKGNCYENALAERVNGILKGEFFLDLRFISKKQAIFACKQAINLYNTVRLHMALDYKTPQQIHAA